jgi:hypothetical protein
MTKVDVVEGLQNEGEKKLMSTGVKGQRTYIPLNVNRFHGSQLKRRPPRRAEE